MSEVFQDRRPKVRLPGDNRLLSDFAHDLGKAIKDADIFQRAGMVFTLDNRKDRLVLMTPDALRSWLEQYAVCYKSKAGTSGEVIELKRTMTKSDAEGVLKSPQFISQLKEIERFNPVRMPSRRFDGSIQLLFEGYDDHTKTYTAAGGPAIVKMPVEMAKVIINDLLREFVFADDKRSRSVAVAAMLTVYGLGILPAKSIRPCFIYTANAEGAGKSLLVKLATVPVLGYAPNGVAPKDEDEMRKILLSAVIESTPVLCFDNFKGHLASESLEGFLTSQDWSGRVLGGQSTFRGDNSVIVFVTGNGCTVSPDMRRRSLFCELFLEAERAEDRQFQTILEVPSILNQRSEILSALWSLIEDWHARMEPQPSRSHSSFPEWAQAIGGIVELAGYGCPLETAKIEASADADGDDMRSLVPAILGDCQLRAVAFDELVEICEGGGLFDRLITGMATEKSRASCTSSFSKLLKSYDKRLIGGCRFSLEGKGRTRRFKVERVVP